jgi:putative colanic acid biosynthesis acetyltransferase WcaF
VINIFWLGHAALGFLMKDNNNIKINLKNYNKQGYKPGKNKLIRLFWFITNALFFQNPLISFSKLKIALLRLFGAKVGAGVRIKSSVNIKYPWKLSIGDYVWIGEKVWIDSLAQITIGNNVCISQGAMLLTGNHDYRKSSFDLIVKGIVLKDGVWIAAKAVVCPGVMAESHAVLTVGAVATKDLQSFCIYQGNPAVKMRKRAIEQ